MNKIHGKWVREIDGEPHWVTPPTIKRENPSTSFPAKVSDATMAQFGCEPAYRPDGPGTLSPDSPNPTYEEDGVTLTEDSPEPIYEVPPLTATQKLVWDTLPTRNGDGLWVQGYQVVEKTEAELISELDWQDLSTAQLALSAWIDKLTFQIEGKYPNVVKAGWAEEEETARAWVAGTETPEQLETLRTLAAAKNRTVVEHVDRVLFLAGSFHLIKGHVHALWLATDGALEAAASPLEYPAIFEAAIAQATPLAAAYGLVVNDNG